MKEDKITNALVEHFKKREKEGWYDKVITEPEAKYNYYGTRGYADLYVRQYEIETHPSEDLVFEIKSSPKSANEVIRQFQKMRKTFYKDDSRSRGRKSIFELCFTPEESNLKHLAENIYMYNALDSKPLMRHPDNISPINPLSCAFDKDFSFWTHLESSNREIYAKAKKWDIPDVFL